MNQPQPSGDSKQQIQSELERQELLKQCHSLVSLIGQKPYANKLLRSVREGLLMHLDYKANRQRRGKS